MKNTHIFHEETPCPRCHRHMYYADLGDRCYAGPICDDCRIHLNKKAGYITEIPADRWDEQGNCLLSVIDPFVIEKLGYVDTE